MIQTEFLIVGQGISGSCLGRALQQAGRSFIVIDNNKPNAASRVASGVINPVTGRRIVKTWMIDELLPFAIHFYQQWCNELQVDAARTTDLIDFFPTPQMLLAFQNRMPDDTGYLSMPAEQDRYRDTFNYDFGYGLISPCFLVSLQELLPAWRKVLSANNQLREDNFEWKDLALTDKVRYHDIVSDKIIFCDGTSSMDLPCFNRLPFAFNKGEALIIECGGEEMGSAIFKKGMNLVPYAKNQYWVGSSYEWNFDDDRPTQSFREKTINYLQSWLTHDFRVLDHLAAVRPATIERRPFVGIHPYHPQVAIFNGMGTKGCSLAPYFSVQLVHQLINNEPVQPDVAIGRFKSAIRDKSKD